METIHRTDANGDGYIDLVFPNTHGYLERGPTWIYTQSAGPGSNWPRRELANDSGWCSQGRDVDGDGFIAPYRCQRRKRGDLGAGLLRLGAARKD